MKSNNPHHLLIYLGINQLLCWLVTLGIVVISTRTRMALPYAVMVGSLMLGSLLMLIYYRCNKELFWQSRPRALLAALTTPIAMSTKINREALILYLLNRISFTNLPAGFCGAMLEMESIELAWTLKAYAFSCVLLLFLQACLLVFWEIKSFISQYQD